MKRSTFDGLLSFLSGVSWAFVIIGSWVTFQSFIFLGLIPALMFTFIFIFLGLFLILVLESMSMVREKNDMIKEHGDTLNKIYEMMKGKNFDS